MVEQREEHRPVGSAWFWFVVRASNGKTLLTSETYDTRAHACRAARTFIESIAPVPVQFTFWFGGQGRSEPHQLTVPIRPVTA
jgi:hypothetical protein